MDHAVNIRMSVEDLVKILFFPNVHFHKLGTFAGNELNPVDDLFARIVEVVAYHNLVACFE